MADLVVSIERAKDGFRAIVKTGELDAVSQFALDYGTRDSRRTARCGSAPLPSMGSSVVTAAHSWRGRKNRKNRGCGCGFQQIPTYSVSLGSCCMIAKVVASSPARVSRYCEA
jgi:hypothetical protein